ncbi:MAG: IPT/TIG domain-containing protein [Chloroflexota bacterium]
MISGDRLVRGGGPAILRRLLAAFTVMALALAAQASTAAPSSAQSSGPLVVKDAKTGAALAKFEYLVNLNNVGDPQVGNLNPDPAKMPSTRPSVSHSPVVLAGDETNAADVAQLPAGKYLVSVMAPGYKLGGKHFTAGSPVEVSLLPLPLPLSKLVVDVFHDNRPVNNNHDIPVEPGLAGFHVIVKDDVGEVTTDYFGNPICTQYKKDANGDVVFDAAGKPVRIPGTGGKCLTGANGLVTIENLPPGKYAVTAIPPDGTDWIQSTTLEGTHFIDVWIEEGNDGYTYEVGVKMPAAWFGFVKPMSFPADSRVKGKIVGNVHLVVEFIPPSGQAVLGDPIYKPYVALNALSQNDQQVYTGRGDANGHFEINNVPDGTYQVMIWDGTQDYIVSFRTAIVSGGNTVVLEDAPGTGKIGVPAWFAQIEGHVFSDDGRDASGSAISPAAAGNGIRDCRDPTEQSSCERGVSGIDVGTRFKDGSTKYAAFTDAKGWYSMKEVFPAGRFSVAEVGFGRFARTGASVLSDYYWDPAKRNQVKSTHDGAITLAQFPWAGWKNRIDWGKRPYNPGENGGITGIVYYAVTRNELNARYAVAESYEPGIPGVTMKLYEPALDANGQPVKAPDGSMRKGALLQTVQTDSWEHPTGCDVRDQNGNPVVVGGINFNDVIGVPCTETPALGGEVRDGVFDGGYAFEGIVPGKYIVEVEFPKDFKGRDLYEIVKEEDVNTDRGDDFVPQIPPPPCAGPMHLVEDDRSPYNGQQMPLCTSRLVELLDGQNAAADFFMFTEVPIPGRMVGLLTDDLNIETAATSIYYGDKMGIPHTPLGIRDYSGRLITTVYSDTNGVFEVLLPSTYTANAPIPSGVSPGMYMVVANDPGDPGNLTPNHNPRYQTLGLAFEVWPGKTTWPDVATLPTGQPCELSPGAPQVWTVSRPYVPATGDRSFNIQGIGFGVDKDEVKVTIGGQEITVNSVTDRTINATVPTTLAGRKQFPVGPAQLLVTVGGKTSPTGITFHVLGTTSNSRYTPTVVTVNPGQKIQDAIDNSVAWRDTLIVVNAGVYYGNLVFHKNVKLQGVGPGGSRTFGVGDVYSVQGSAIDGSLFPANQAAWEQVLPNVPGGATVTVFGEANEFKSGFRPSIDGFAITGGTGEEGGGVYVHVWGRYLEISNNRIEGNSGQHGGAIVLGRPYVGDNNNDGIDIHHNQIKNNGGVMLAGAVGIYNGADGYDVANNEICGNNSAEYGGGISHFGYSPKGRIHHNKIVYNNAFDEGGGVLVGGELPKPSATRSQGSGTVDIHSNLIQGNLSNDDGGGIRLLVPMRYRINITNNMVVDNVATDLGGGIALDDAPDVVIANNTIAKNITTATAEDSDGNPHAAGLSSEPHSPALMQTLPWGSPNFSDPVLFDNIFWDNLAGSWDGSRIVGIGEAGDPTPINRIDLEVFGVSGALLKPNYSILHVPYGYTGTGNKVGADPTFVQPYDLALRATPWRMDPTFIGVVIVAPEGGTFPGDYHIASGSPAIEAGVANFKGVNAPTIDYDGDARPLPTGGKFDVGADEYK